MRTAVPRPHDHSALPPGTRLNEMEILRVLAVGGFGIVYLARDHSLDRDVAVKEFMPAQLAGRSVGQRVTVRSMADYETFQLGTDFVRWVSVIAHNQVHRFRRAERRVGPQLSDATVDLLSQDAVERAGLVFGAWCLSGVWSLAFGVVP